MNEQRKREEEKKKIKEEREEWNEERVEIGFSIKRSQFKFMEEFKREENFVFL